MTRLTGGDVLEYCLGKPGTWQDEPWEGDVVAKVGDKIFAFLGSGDAVGTSYELIVAKLPKSRRPPVAG